MNAKKIAAEKAVEEIRDGMVVGLGTGSTAEFAVLKVGERVQQGLRIEALCTSLRTERLAKKMGIPLADPDTIDRIDLSIDGADQIDKHNHLIKGGGGSLLREKIVAFSSRKFLVVVDSSKLTTTFSGVPLPVEIVPFAFSLTFRRVAELGSKPVLRKQQEDIFITDNGNFILDCDFGMIEDPSNVDRQLKAIPGVVETGLFLNGMVTDVFIGRVDGSVERRKIQSKVAGVFWSQGFNT